MCNQLQFLDGKFVTVTHYNCFSYLNNIYSRIYTQGILWNGKKTLECLSNLFQKEHIYSHALIKVLTAS